MRSAWWPLALLLSSAQAVSADRCTREAFAAHAADAPTLAPLVISLRAAGTDPETRVLPGGQGDDGLSGDEGFRTASITKTYVAATVLRLSEAGDLDLDAPLSDWLRDDWRTLLADDGYDVARITVRHLLSHTAGFADHAQTPEFLDDIRTHRGAGWSRERVVGRLVAWTDPVAAPGERYAYSDTGYVLLGALIEQVTGRPLAEAVRTQLDFEGLGLTTTWWEGEESPAGRARVRQVYEGIDTHDWDPSMDRFGGGGLVASARDMAVFFAALFEGRVFERAETLALMRSAQGLPTDSPYRLGLLDYRDNGVPAEGHSGFWGTLALHAPASGRTIAGGVVDRTDMPRLRTLVHALARCDSPAGAGAD